MKHYWYAIVVLLLALLACMGGPSGPHGVIAKPIWEISNTFDPNSIQYYNGAFYAMDDNGQLTDIDETTGLVRWQIQVDAYRVSREAGLIYVSAGTNCQTINPASGETVELLSSDKHYLCDPFRRDDGNLNFIFNDDNSVTAQRADTGETIWSSPLDLPQESVFPQPPGEQPYLADGIVIVYSIGFHADDPNTEYMNFQALASGSGAIIWQLVDVPFGKAVRSGNVVILSYAESRQVEPTVSGQVLPTLSGPFQLSARDLSTGEELWHVETTYAVDHYIVDTIFYQCNNGDWQWFDLTSGKLLGEKKGVAKDLTYSCPNSDTSQTVDVLANDTWFVIATRTSKDNTNFENPIQDSWYNAFELSSGKLLWSTELLEHSVMGIAALGKSDVLIFRNDKLSAYPIRAE